MKKIILLLCVALSVTLTNCKKEASATSAAEITDASLQTEAVTPDGLAAIAAIKSMHNQDLKKIAFRLLKPSEKAALWKDNLKSVSTNFNDKQKALIDELTSFFTSKVFSVNGPSPEITAFRDQWLAKAYNGIFTYDEIRNIAFNIYAATDQKESLQVNMATVPDCVCNSGSAFTCDPYTPCHEDYQWKCNRSSFGCGFGGIWPCDNMCGGSYLDK